jgi:ribonuclease E
VAAVAFGGVCLAQPTGGASTQPAAYDGPYLTWAGKEASAAQPSQPDVAPSRAAASESEFAAWPAPAPGAPRLHRAATAAASPAYVAPAHVYTPHARPRPAAVAAYVAPPETRPAQIAVSATSPAAAPAPSPAEAPAQALAQNDTPPAASASSTTGVHYYSLHREYGLTPDPVATPKDRPMVLIGPPDDPTPPKQDDADDAGPSAQHGGAAGADE